MVKEVNTSRDCERSEPTGQGPTREPQLPFNSSPSESPLPIYLAPNKDKVLTGGVTLDYVTRGQGFGITVFANKSFSLFCFKVRTTVVDPREWVDSGGPSFMFPTLLASRET